jgi:hypothetical protein
MGLGLLTVLVVPSGRAEPLRTPAEEEEEDRCDEEEEDELENAIPHCRDAPVVEPQTWIRYRRGL